LSDDKKWKSAERKTAAEKEEQVDFKF